MFGAGFENLTSAVNAKVALDPVSISFGEIPSGSGQTQTFNVTLTNVTSAYAAYSVSVSNGGEVAHAAVFPFIKKFTIS